jgi:hypothetical protein
MEALQHLIHNSNKSVGRAGALGYTDLQSRPEQPP